MGVHHRIAGPVQAVVGGDVGDQRGVSGGDVGARNGTLSVMAGGEEWVVESLRSLFDCMASTVAWMGEAGNGQHTKMANQLAVAGTMIGVCEALLYAYRVALTGVHLLETGEVIGDVRETGPIYGIDGLDDGGT